MPASDNLGHKFLSLFIKDVELPSPAPPPPTAPLTPPMPGAATPSSLVAGTTDDKFAEHLANVLAKHNLPGPDYFEFRETLRGLAGLGLPEDKQFQAAWASFKALGGPADIGVLTTTANQYLAALAADREAFSKSVDEAMKARVGGLESERTQLQAANEALTRQLAELQQRLAANQARLQGIGGEINEQGARLNQSRQNYEATYSHFTQQLKDDLRKMEQYLR